MLQALIILFYAWAPDKFLCGYFFHWEIGVFFPVSYVLLSSRFLAVTYIFLCCIVCISKLSLLCILVLSHVFVIYVPLLCQKVSCIVYSSCRYYFNVCISVFCPVYMILVLYHLSFASSICVYYYAKTLLPRLN